MNVGPICRRNLKAIVSAHRRATGRSLAAISKEVYGHVDFLRQFFARDKGVTLDKYDEIIGVFQSAWPAGAEWPHLDSIIFEPPRKKKTG